MQNLPVAIAPYHEKFKNQLITIWEKSVKATHHFLKPGDIAFYKEILKNTDFTTFQVYCLMQGDRVLGFLGVADGKLEMLFLDPDYIGQGFGKKLMLFALQKLQVNRVDVNEQNTAAVQFYRNFNFVPFNRTEKDATGKDYPILEMKLERGLKETM
ncbi:GNAT family N-acetyltransferase [Adhaeribacter swui]|uniref:GNAT family N-acetyltransferase n=1 Tax=Adhaeribacter swui TaxID=2086471 RepID=A0A7G7G925_9BACT|nr:GNAT family N-acetyltransferase [Adhaeribacter swui]QNF33659.1 GNAT family N-acetyltransferase [Adhaeribacter swui]